MARVMFLGIVIAAYLAYLGLGAVMSYPVAYADWEKPFWHYGALPDDQWKAFVIPGVLAVLAAYNWYQKSMLGEP